EAILLESLLQLNTRYSEHRTCVTGDGQRRGARRDDGVSLSDERGPKNGFGKPICNESAGNKGTCSRAPEDLGAALRSTVSPMPWSYDSRASGGSLYPLTAGCVANT